MLSVVTVLHVRQCTQAVWQISVCSQFNSHTLFHCLQSTSRTLTAAEHCTMLRCSQRIIQHKTPTLFGCTIYNTTQRLLSVWQISPNVCSHIVCSHCAVIQYDNIYTWCIIIYQITAYNVFTHARTHTHTHTHAHYILLTNMLIMYHTIPIASMYVQLSISHGCIVYSLTPPDTIVLTQRSQPNVRTTTYSTYCSLAKDNSNNSN